MQKRWRRFIKYEKKSAIVHGFKTQQQQRWTTTKKIAAVISHMCTLTQHQKPPHTSTTHTPHTLINWRMRKETHKWRVSEWMNERVSEKVMIIVLGYASFFVFVFCSIYSSLLCPPTHISHLCYYALAEKEVKRRWWCKAMLLYLCLNYQIPFAWQQKQHQKKNNSSSIKKSSIKKKNSSSIKHGNQKYK